MAFRSVPCVARRIALLLAVAAAGACAHGPSLPPLPMPDPAGVDPSSVAPQPVVPATSPVAGSERPRAGTRPSEATVRAERARVLREPDDAPALAPADATATGDLGADAYVAEARVVHFVELFSGSARERIQAKLSRGTRYEAMIRRSFREGGLPEDLYYLALIESGFDPNAVSRASAVGMWQFMSETGRDMGLRVDGWVDERRDPVRSTAAAVRFLRALQDQFGSLTLATAAYNGGPGRIARGLEQNAEALEGASADDAFFVLAATDAIYRETKDYVPQLIAAAIVGRAPEQYGLRITPEPAFEYEVVSVGPTTALSAVASAARASLAAIRDLNPHLLRGMTPPGGSTIVRVPVGATDDFPRRLAAVPAAEREGVQRRVARKGETAAGLARAAGIPVAMLRAMNPRLSVQRSGRLTVGQTVLLPTPAAVAGARLVDDEPTAETLGGAPVPGTRRGQAVYHVVRRGETLSGLARRYRTTTASLMRWNRLRKPVIIAGQEIVVSAPAPAAKPARHLVRRGETLSGLAQRYGTTTATLMRWNRLRTPVLIAGRTILVSAPTARPAPRTKAGTRAKTSAVRGAPSGAKTHRAAGAAKGTTAGTPKGMPKGAATGSAIGTIAP